MAKTIVKVIGIGGAGGNAIDRMVQCKVKGVELAVLNTDVQDLKKNRAPCKLRIGKESTQGLGAGMNPELGRKAALESKEEIKEILEGADMIFLAAGLGGGTGSGAIPVVAEIARDQESLTIAVVTKPFSFEGALRMRIAQKAVGELRGKVDTLLMISNDKILQFIEQETTVLAAFWKTDEVLRQAVQGISDLIALPGIINVDFADIRSIMRNSGDAFVGIGRAKGEKRMETALAMAVHSPLLEVSFRGAKGILFHVGGSEDLSLSEIQQGAQIIKEEVSPHAEIIFGAVYDKSLKQGEVKITVIATGFESSVS